MRGSKTKYRFEQAADGGVHKLYIYDDVTAYGEFDWKTWKRDESETSAKYFRDQLEGIQETAEIELHVNSCGGEVREGIAIYNMLKQHGAHKTCYVDGFAYSIAGVICMACDRIVMGLGTSMLIHNMSMCVEGDAKTLRKCADDLDVLMESNRQIYLARAKNLTEGQLKEMMDKETFLTPEQCLEYGFCDEVADYQADQGQMGHQAMEQVKKLREQMDGFRSLREEMLQFAGNAPHRAGQQENSRNQKVIKMMGAFVNAFQKGEGNEE